MATVLIQDVATLLKTLNPAGGVWAMINTAEPPTYPYIVFQRISSTDNVSLQGRSGMQNTRLQVDFYSRLYSEADSLSTAADAAFQAWALWQNVALSQQEFYEDQVKVFRVSRDYSIWSTN